MNLSRRISAVTFAMLGAASIFVCSPGYGEDQLDTKLHSEVSNKIQNDHQQAIRNTSRRSPPVSASRPRQIQQLQKKKAGSGAPLH